MQIIGKVQFPVMIFCSVYSYDFILFVGFEYFRANYLSDLDIFTMYLCLKIKDLGKAEICQKKY